MIPSPKSRGDEKVNYSDSNEQFSPVDDVCLESDECGYDSDCSLGSLNSLCSRLNIKSKNLNFTSNVNKIPLDANDSSKIGTTSACDTVTKNQISKNKPYDETHGKPIATLSPKYFYGKQVKRYFNSRFHISQLKKRLANREIFKTKHLKKPIFQLDRNVLKEMPQNNKKCSSTDIDEKWLHFEKDCIKNRETGFDQNYYVEYDSIDRQSSKSDDFTDTDDFGGCREVEDILKKLFDESNNSFDESSGSISYHAENRGEGTKDTSAQCVHFCDI